MIHAGYRLSITEKFIQSIKEITELEGQNLSEIAKQQKLKSCLFRAVIRIAKYALLIFTSRFVIFHLPFHLVYPKVVY